MVEEHHVDVPDIQLIKRHIDGDLGIAELIRVYLGDNKDFLTGNAIFLHASADTLAHGLLISVHIGRVNEPAAVFQKRHHGAYAGIVIERIGAETEDRHLIAAVQHYGAGIIVEHSHR